MGGLVVCEGGEPIEQLANHPSPRHVKRDGGQTTVLQTTLSELVCDKLELPENADCSNVYVGQAFSQGAGEPFVRAVWYTPKAADTLCGRPSGHERITEELYQMWCEDARLGSSSNQPASGQNLQLGLGIMPGVGREAFHVGCQSFTLPFPRNAELSTKYEDVLGEFLSDVGEVLAFATPTMMQQSAEEDVVGGKNALSSMFAHACQYPRLRDECRSSIKSHQVWLRGLKSDWGHETADIQAWQSCSDLHVDPWDGGGKFGACTIYTCTRLSSSELGNAERERHLLLHRGLAVFPSKVGGRGVH